MTQSEDKADDCWTEFGAAGDPDRAPTPGRLDDLAMNERLIRAGYRRDRSARFNRSAILCPDGSAIFANNEDAVWAAARLHYRRTLLRVD